MELEKDHLYNKYKERVGEIITGEVYQIWKRETLILDDEGNELIMPKDQQIKTDFFKKGDNVRAVVWKVEMRNNTPGGHPEPHRALSSSRSCSSRKCPKWPTASSPSSASCANPVSAPRWPWRATMTASTRWALAWA
jgi:hypothetical protein